nr:hypothetical protein [Tanacetum cinerariifolium]
MIGIVRDKMPWFDKQASVKSTIVDMGLLDWEMELEWGTWQELLAWGAWEAHDVWEEKAWDVWEDKIRAA